MGVSQECGSGTSGAAGGDAPTQPQTGGNGGVGVQIPTIFQNTKSASGLGYPGSSGTYWVAAGGGAGAGNGGLAGVGGQGGTNPTGSTDPYAGAGSGAAVNGGDGTFGKTNSGSGGGGAGGGSGVIGGSGGSGLVLIAYPS